MFEQALKYLKLLPKLIGLFGYSYLNPDVSLYLKTSAIAGIIYFFSPLDIIPDFITGIGLLDDFILSLILIQMFLKKIPRPVLEPMMDRLGTTYDDLAFDVEDAVKVVYSTSRALWVGIEEATSKIVEYYGKRKEEAALRLVIEGEKEVISDSAPGGDKPKKPKKKRKARKKAATSEKK